MSTDKLHDGWTRVKFGDVVRNVNENSRDLDTDGIDRVVGLDHLEPGSLSLERWGNLAGLPDGTTFTRKFKPGQVLFGKRRAYQRKVAVPDFEGVCSGDILVFEPADQRMLAEFLPYLVQSDGFFNHALGTSAGSLSPRTKWAELAKYEFALPSIDNQRTAVELLGAADRALNGYRAALEAAHASLVALCRELTSDQSTLVPLTSVCDVLDSSRIPLNDSQRANLRGDIPYYGANGVVDYVAEAIFDEPLVLIPEDQHGGFFSLWKSKSMAYRIDGPAWVNNHAHVLRARDVPIDWLYFSLVHRDLRPWVNESTRSKLNRSSLNVIPLAVPPDLNGRLDVLRAADQTRSACEANVARMASVVTSLRRALLEVAQDVL